MLCFWMVVVGGGEMTITNLPIHNNHKMSQYSRVYNNKLKRVEKAYNAK